MHTIDNENYDKLTSYDAQRQIPNESKNGKPMKNQ